MQVEWNNPKEPQKGFQYLYLTDADYQAISAKSPGLLVKANAVTAHGDASPPDSAQLEILPSKSVWSWL